MDRSAHGAPRPAPDEPVDARLGALIFPLRLFLGLTFIYAGLVKLVDPSFLDATAPGSLAAQLEGFARDSPLAPLITTIGIPLATPIGLLVALGELAVGIGALTGLAGRAAAWCGGAISVLFWLTASWPVKPYFLGPDLPYAMGWLTLALLGDGRRFVLSWRSVLGLLDRLSGRHSTASETFSSDRRAAIEVITVGAVALVAAGLALQRPSWLRDWLGGSSTAGPTGATVRGPSVSSRPSTAGPNQVVIGSIAALDTAGSATFFVPTTGDPGVLVKLASGSVVAFDAVCTHAGCPVQYVPQDRALECPCHGAAFDPAHHGAVLAGPTNTPLLELAIVIDRASGQISLAG